MHGKNKIVFMKTYNIESNQSMLSVCATRWIHSGCAPHEEGFIHPPRSSHHPGGDRNPIHLKAALRREAASCHALIRCAGFI
jgi:hypothetical protein